MPPSRLPPSLAKRFRTGRACLDFAHTGGGGGDWVEPELVPDTPTLERWLAHVLDLQAVRARSDDLAAAHGLRDAVWQLAHARTQGRALPPGAVLTVNVAAHAPPPVVRMTSHGAREPVVAPAEAALSAVARDAVDLFTGPLGHRVRICAATDCALLFVDASRAGSRRWCSMERCGNLAKTRTHRAARTSSLVVPGQLSAGNAE